MALDLAIFIGVPLGVALTALHFGVDTTDGDDWTNHPKDLH